MIYPKCCCALALQKMREIIDAAKQAGICAIIASDMAAILYARSIGQEVHFSTQVNVTNVEAVKFYLFSMPAPSKVRASDRLYLWKE